MNAFAKFEIEILYMDLVYVDEVAKDNKGAKFSPARLDLFDRTVDAKRMITKDSKETVGTFSDMITKKNRLKKFWVEKVTEFGGVPKKLSKAGERQIHSKMIEDKFILK